MKIFISTLLMLSMLLISCDTNTQKANDEIAKSNPFYKEALEVVKSRNEADKKDNMSMEVEKERPEVYTEEMQEAQEDIWKYRVPSGGSMVKDGLSQICH